MALQRQLKREARNSLACTPRHVTLRHSQIGTLHALLSHKQAFGRLANLIVVDFTVFLTKIRKCITA